MKSNIGRLVKINLLQRFNYNEARYSKDPAKKRRLLLLAVCMVLVTVILVGYVSGIAWGLCYLGAAECVPAYMMIVTSVVIFFLTIFKAGSVIFQMQTYEMLIALPLSVREIVLSRFITMYLDDLLLSLLTMLPCCIIYAFFEKTGVLFWLMAAAGIVIIPLFPLVIATIIGVVIIAAGARVRHRNLITLVLSMLFLVGILAVCYLPALLGPQDTIDMNQITNIGSVLIEKVNSLYFMASLYTAGLVEGNLFAFLGFLLISLAVFLLFETVTEKHFARICSLLTARSTKGNYKLETMKQVGVRRALFQKEWRRYFASNVYVMNTAVGYVMMLLMALLIAVVGVDKLEETIQMPGFIGKVLPFLLAFTVSMAPVTASSISMEGKNWWIPMSLPITAKEIVQSKMMVSLSLALPTCLMSAILTGIRFWHSPKTLVLLFAVPAAYSIFIAVVGIAVNEHFPMMKWDNEVAVVKQSASTLISILLGFAATGVPIGILMALPDAMTVPAEWISIFLLLGVSMALYRFAVRFDFRKIET